jgi:hypothetical protein
VRDLRFPGYNALTAVHSAQHARNEAVDTPALLHKRYERRDAALVVVRVLEVGKDHALERVHLVLEVHQVRDRLVAAGVSDCRRKTATDLPTPRSGRRCP